MGDIRVTAASFILIILSLLGMIGLGFALLLGTDPFWVQIANSRVCRNLFLFTSITGTTGVAVRLAQPNMEDDRPRPRRPY